MPFTRFSKDERIAVQVMADMGLPVYYAATANSAVSRRDRLNQACAPGSTAEKRRIRTIGGANHAAAHVKRPQTQIKGYPMDEIGTLGFPFSLNQYQNASPALK
jgi:hypothetical protein